MSDFFKFLMEFFPAEIRFHPVYLIPFLIMAFIVYVVRDKTANGQKSFFPWAFPPEVYFHPSHFTDIKLFLMGQVLIFFKLLNVVFVQGVCAFIGMGVVSLVTGLEMSEHEMTWQRIFLATFIITIVTDFCVYWVHRFHHETPVFWPFHAVHHSAEVMTPITVYRKHPLYDLISNLVKYVLIGFAQGVVLMLLMGKVEINLIVGVNVFYFAFNALGSNFRHSHMWLRYGNILEHIFISPAQHQIHHSLEPRHHNKNYGEILALWDWLFGTLYIPEGYEKISYGISKSSTSNERVIQPHPTLIKALVVPFKESWKIIKRRHKKKQ